MLGRALAVACLCACSSPAAEITGEFPEVTAMTFNVQGAEAIEDPVRGENIAGQILAMAPQFVSLQQCGGCEALLDRLPARYALREDPASGVALVHDADAWEAIDDGVIELGANDDGWGRRVALWERMRHRETGHVIEVYSTHWCVSIRRDDDACDAARQIEYADAILGQIEDHDVDVILGGDFNVFDGYEDGAVVQHLVARGLVDAFREVSDEEVITFQGTDWAPAGRIDYVFTTDPVDVIAGDVDMDSVPEGEGSDHNPVTVVLTF